MQQNSKINLKNIILFTAIICALIACKIDSKKEKSITKDDDIYLSISNLTSDDKVELVTSGCANLPISLYKKVGLTNIKYDTLWIAVTDYCQQQKPFLLYDMASYFNNDTLVSRDFINTSSGYEIPLLNGDSISLFLRLKDDRYTQEIKFEARTTVSGQVTFHKYVIKVKNTGYK